VLIVPDGFNFVPYEPAQIDPNRSYALLAEIQDDTGKLIFSSISP